MRYSRFIKFIGLTTFGYLAILSLSYGNTSYQPLIILLLGSLLYFVTKAMLGFCSKYGFFPAFGSIFLVGAATRFLWAIFVPTEPFSDFLYYHESAIKLSQGSYVLTKNIGYTLFLSLGYKIYPSVLTGKLLNAISSSLSLVFLYLVGEKLGNQRVALVATLLFSIFASEIMMVSVLGTEVFATMLGTVVLFLIAQHIDKPRSKYILLLGFFYGLSLCFRSSFLFYFPGIMAYVLGANFGNLRKLLNSFMNFLFGVASGIALILVCFALLTSTNFSLKPLQTQDSLPILSGTNLESSGTWSKQDYKLYSSWDSNERDQFAKQEAWKRITSNPKGFLLLIPRKIYLLMAPSDYGNWWSLKGVDWGRREKSLIAFYSQAIYALVMVFALFAFEGKKITVFHLMVLIILLSTLLPHIVLEVQPRYHHYIVPYLILISAIGMHNKHVDW